MTRPSLGQLAIEVAFAQREAGVEAPPYPSKNWSPDVAEYFRSCVRDTDSDGVLDDIGAYLAKVGGNWCAASACYCTAKALEPEASNEYLNDVLVRHGVPHLYRAGVVEIVADARELGRYVTSDEWHAGAEIRPGDLAIWDRSDPARPETSWWRHVNRVLEQDAAALTLRTIGGNESRRWTVATHAEARIKSKLLGFVRYWSENDLPPPLISDEERARIRAQIAECTAELMRGWR